jgi:hypothetical protein
MNGLVDWRIGGLVDWWIGTTKRSRSRLSVDLLSFSRLVIHPSIHSSINPLIQPSMNPPFDDR